MGERVLRIFFWLLVIAAVLTPVGLLLGWR
jgi:hypothetical protein